MSKIIENEWHAYSLDTVFEKLQTSPEGLDEKEIKRRLKLYGSNSIELKSSVTLLSILIRQFHNPIVYILIFSTLLSFLLGKFTDALVIFMVVVLNTLIGFIQEYKAHKIIKSLTAMVSHHVTAIRRSGTKLLHPTQLVPGDIVSLQAGDRIPSDLRLFTTKNFQCDESMLTGESLPVNKDTFSSSTNTLLAERKCMAYMGTYVTSGIALGVIVKTGSNTEFGKISTLIGGVQSLETPLTFTLKKIAQGITIGVLTVSAGLFLIGYIRGNALFDAAFSAVALAVAAIPEGLPAIITIASSIGVRRMAQGRAIIRQLPAVEALGSTSVICTDKTGTLTYNEMTVQRVWTKSGFAIVSGGGYSIEGHFFSEKQLNQAEISELLEAAILCNDASLGESSNGLVPLGDPTEVALVIAGRKTGLNEEQLRKHWHRKDVLPFESERRIMVTLNSSHMRYLFLKGAPEDVLSRCKDVDTNSVMQHVQIMAKEGMRVLAIARKKVAQSLEYIDEEEISSGFELLGLIAMIDPPRKEVYQALKACREAGITVKMITGDHPTTAEAISRDLGILGHGKVITGLEMNAFSDEEWKYAVNYHHVFARSSPEHKLKIVETLQAAGHVIAMTGDGVNDAAALKRADIGVAMGIKGTSVAKEASDMILADDNFASIEAAVEEGRRVYDNLIKSLAFLIPTNLGQALVILFAVVFFPIHENNLLHPIQPIQILWVNLIVAVGLSLPLAFEPAEEDVMKRPPRQKNSPILSRFLLLKTLIVGALISIGTIGLFLWKYRIEIVRGHTYTTAVAEAQTVAVTAIILFQIFYLFQCRSIKNTIQRQPFFSNHFIFMGVGVVLLAQVAFIYVPFMNRLFHASRLDVESWIVVLFITFLIVPVTACLNLIRKMVSHT